MSGKPLRTEGHNMGEYVTRRIPLAGGREVEIVYYNEPISPDALAPGLPAGPSTDLHICRGCGCELVQPTSWDALPGDLWRIGRRCPSCLDTTTETVSQEEAELYDDILSEGMEEALCTLREVSRRRMSEDVERMTAAIWDDLLLPFDF